MYKVITNCPVCDKEMKIMKLKCNHCNTTIENEFSFTKFNKLSKEQLNFIEVFLACRGNIKDVEKHLGISYPTVRGKLDEINNALNPNIKKDTSKEKQNIMDMLENGEISSDEAINLLKKIIKTKLERIYSTSKDSG
ncbi:DUF2089 domain-containing protein [Paraclostridium bifermentans]|uniref:DUF2089 domain-containing protein n=1 Tax=Paraclostridium bifermentans TaxID=1490 RepID=UPI0021C446CE|nr:DUF2089 domain-containing protein [Paraclostridium bifermentans]GKZ07115.1 hypothetical protein ANS015_19980 [Paraclostridium bifermentans]